MFIKLLISACVYSIIACTIFVYSLVLVFKDRNDAQTKIPIFLYIVLFFNFLVTLTLVILQGKLLLLHKWLRKNNLTTFQYIMLEREKAEKLKLAQTSNHNQVMPDETKNKLEINDQEKSPNGEGKFGSSGISKK